MDQNNDTMTTILDTSILKEGYDDNIKNIKSINETRGVRTLHY